MVVDLSECIWWIERIRIVLQPDQGFILDGYIIWDLGSVLGHLVHILSIAYVPSVFSAGIWTVIESLDKIKDLLELNFSISSLYKW